MNTYKFYLVLILCLTVNIVSAQSRGVTGKVTDKSGDALPGVSVSVVGTTVGTITDQNGNFSITVNSEGKLKFFFLGMKEVVLDVGNKITITVVMEEDVDQLEEIVVMGYSSQKAGTVTGSVEQIETSSLHTTTPNVSNMLQGKVAGVSVASSSGRPGSSGTLRIRGIGSVNNNQSPLWVVDGVVGLNADALNPDNIKSISILKDAAATALYGSRGSNGVVVVTTKQGSASQEVISVSANVGVNQISFGNFELMNASQLYDYQEPWSNYPWFSASLKETDFDWRDEATQLALNQNYLVSYSGGSHKLRTYLSGGYYNEEGTAIGYDYDKYTGRINMDYSLSRFISLHAKLFGSYQESLDNSVGFYNMYLSLPWDNPYNPDGSLRKITSSTPDDQWIGRDKTNLFYDRQFNYSKTRVYRSNLSLGFDVFLTPNLTFVSQNNITLTHSRVIAYVDPKSVAGTSTNGSLRHQQSLVTQRYTNQMLKYNKSFNDHHVSALLAYEYSDYQYEDIDGTGEGVIQNRIALNNVASIAILQGTLYDWKIQSVLFNMTYDYQNKYLAQFSYRTDGSSKFGSDRRYGSFYNVSLGWDVAQEEFMNSISVLSQFKLRTSLGTTGNVPNNNYAHQTLYSIQKYNGSTTLFPSQIGNSELTWETTRTFNFAIDGRLFDNFPFVIEVYNKKTENILYYVPFSALSGFDGQYQNIGNIINKGVEVSFSPVLLKNNDMIWDMNFSASYNTNEITKLKDNIPVISGNKIQEEGSSINTWYLREWAGVNPEDGTPQWYKVESDGSKTIVSNRDLATVRNLGKSAIPPFSFGFGTSVTYKSWTFSTNFDGVAGNYIFNSARELFDNDGAYATYNQMVLQPGWSRWEKPGDIATHPKPVKTGNNSAHKPSSRFLEDGSFIKWRNIYISYEFSLSWMKKIGLSKASLSFSIDNIYTFTKYSGTDPEVTIGYNASTSSVGNGSTNIYPIPRKYIASLSLQF